MFVSQIEYKICHAEKHEKVVLTKEDILVFQKICFVDLLEVLVLEHILSTHLEVLSLLYPLLDSHQILMELERARDKRRKTRDGITMKPKEFVV